MVNVPGALRLLRGHVAGRAHGFSGVGQFRVGRGHVAAVAHGFRPRTDDLRQSEIRHFYLAPAIQEEVLGFDVAVHDAVVVRELERVANLRHDGERLARLDAPGVEQLAQVHAVHELHEEKVKPVRPPELVERDDVRVIELGQRPGFAREPFGKRRGVANAGRQNFQRHDPIQFTLARPVDRPHPAPADQLHDFQLREFCRQFGNRRRHEPRGRPGPRKRIGRHALPQ